MTELGFEPKQPGSSLPYAMAFRWFWFGLGVDEPSPAGDLCCSSSRGPCQTGQSEAHTDLTVGEGVCTCCASAV